MDGNGRWAARRGRPRAEGHVAGAETVRRVVEAAPQLGVGILTLYAFSSDNWQRPTEEVQGLLTLFGERLRREVEHARTAGVRLSVIGRRDRLPLPLRAAIAAAERATAGGRRLWLRLAIDYSARDQLLRAARHLGGITPTRERFSALLGEAAGGRSPAPDVDLLIRTGGEQRLSDFLLWESAYAELWFSRTAWPDFSVAELRGALDEYRGRERRFGALPEASGA